MVQFEPLSFVVDGVPYMITTKEQLFRKLATMTDLSFEAWAAGIALTPAPDEGSSNFRLRVIDVIEQVERMSDSDINKKPPDGELV